MNRPPLLTLSDIALTFGGRPVFAGLELAVGAGDRIALVGRNGSGKSTLMKVMAGLTEADAGTRFVQPGVTVSYMAQDPDMAGYATLAEFVAEPLPVEEGYRAEIAMEGLGMDGGLDPAQASGGERRRAALARLVAQEPDLMLLDEPTNHLDIAAIGWLEAHLAQTRAGFVLISHDRAFLRALSRATLWIDRGEVRRLDRGFAAFEDWRDKVYEEEDLKAHKLDRLIKAEARWAVEGISARRKRNQGRVRRLEGLRAERREAIARTGTAQMALEAGPKSGRLVIEAEGLAKRFGTRVIIRDLSLRVMRGERLALVGPNGAGKTTVLKLLTGALAPDAGRIRLGTGLEEAVFDQNRAQLDPSKSLWETLTLDPALGRSGSSDQIVVRGKPRHVVAYLKEFLFEERQARGPVSALSGGEKARLLMARIMARESNLLILDEPTNDLDIETLDLLQELLDAYDGTVLLVSHDRDFLDRVASTTIEMTGDGRATVYAGGWSDMQAQKAAAGMDAPAPLRAEKQASRPPKPPPAKAASKPRMSFKQTHRLDALPGEIDRVTAEIEKLEAFLADPDLYATAPEKFAKATDALAERQALLTAMEEEWLELETLREETGG
ncbi:MAG: ABC-F family ATP-binding cassette domain-containing protein [Pseudomonadota bacterium]